MKTKQQNNDLILLDEVAMKKINGGDSYYIVVNGQLILVVDKRE
jgi:hypothetical protein